MRIAQLLDYPTIRVDVDRARALELGVNQRDLAADLLIGLATNVLIQPTYFLDLKNGVNYSVLEQVPQHMYDSVQALGNTPLTPASSSEAAGSPQLLSNVATVRQDVEPAVVNHYNIQRVIDVDSSVEGRDLGSASAAVQHAIDSLGELPRGTHLTIRGQTDAMNESFTSLRLGIVLAIVLVYLLMVANFQSSYVRTVSPRADKATHEFDVRTIRSVRCCGKPEVGVVERHETYSTVFVRRDYAGGLEFWRLCLLEGCRCSRVLPESRNLLPQFVVLLGWQARALSDDAPSRLSVLA